MKRILVAAALIATLAAFSGPAHGQAVCANRDAMVAELARVYSEVRVVVGINRGSTLIEIWAAPDGATWTLLETFPNGRACIRAFGTALESVAVPVRKEETSS